jgi:glycerophosphoryl diester phosphodiesterase
MTVVHHKANHDTSPHPPNTLEAIIHCLDAGADWIEIDVFALADGDYLVTHDNDLSAETTGSGVVGELPAAQADGLRLKAQPDYRVPLLSAVVDLFASRGALTRLQLDFKSFLPFHDDEPLRRLASLVAPVKDRVLVSSPADWHLRGLRRIDANLALGFDPQFYLARRDPDVEYDPRLPPYREGAYGYHDDALLSLQRSMSTADYVRDRCELLLHQVPGITAVYLDYKLLLASLDDGFNWVDAIGEVDLFAWTLDVPAQSEAITRLYEAGVRHFTTDTPAALGALLA